jgi:hypothetical protein
MAARGNRNPKKDVVPATQGTSALAVLNNEDEQALDLDIFHKLMTIRSIQEQKRMIRFDLAIQRNEVWKENKNGVFQQSLLIDSVLRKYPIGQVFVIQMGDEFMWMADGKQRWTTIFKYLDNGFPLAKGTRPVKAKDPETGEVRMYNIEGKFFKDLDKVLQNKILNYEMDVKHLTNATPAEIEEIFLRLNNGTPLTKIELTRVELGEENMVKVAKIADKPFFKALTAISADSRNRFIDHEMILQTLMIISGRDTDISGNEIREFAKVVKTNGLSDDVVELMIKVADFLEAAFSQFIAIKDGKPDMKILKQILKKVHVPIVVNTAVETIYREGQEIEAEVFGLWAKDFLYDRYKTGSTYGRACAGGSAKKDNVKTRIKEMRADFNKHIEKIKQTYEENADIREQIKKEREEAEAAEKLRLEEEARNAAENNGEGNDDKGNDADDVVNEENNTPEEPSGDDSDKDKGEEVNDSDSDDKDKVEPEDKGSEDDKPEDGKEEE